MSGALDRELRARLEDAAAGAVRDLDPPRALPGASLPVAVEPRDADSLAAVLAALDGARVPAAILGAGTKVWLGNPLRGARILISTLGLAGIDELDEADGVVRVAAGTPLEALAAAAGTAGWASPIDAPGRGGTVGGALASALAGPRRPGFGPARDAVLGLDTVLACGSRTRCGARVVKNVTGYDLAKLYVGSLGTLGVIERAWLRLRVVPERETALHAALDDDGAIEFALAVARRATARAVALVGESLAAAAPGLGDPPRGGARWRLVVELAGDAVAVERDAAWLAAERGAEQAPDESIEALRALQTHAAPIGVRVRVHVLPSALARTAAALERGGARLLVQPVPGVVTACFEAAMDDGEDPWWLDRVLGVVDEARAAARGEAVVEALPAWAQGRRDVFGGACGLSLMRALKRRFDPNGILNPGRFAGAI